jgi:tellurite resistance protein TerC
LVLHALHENNVPFINNGEPVPVIEISTGTSLTVILGVLAITVVGSLVSPKGRARTAVVNVRRYADEYLDLSYTTDPVERQRVYNGMLAAEKVVAALPAKYRAMIKQPEQLREKLGRAHGEHEQHFSI